MNPSEKQIKTMIKWVLIMIIIIPTALNSFYTISEQEAAVVTTFGIA